MRTLSYAGKASLAAIAAALFLTGCSVLGGLTRPVTSTETRVIPPQTNLVVEVTPQPPQVIYVTNTVAGAPVVITNLVERPPVVITNTVVIPGTNVLVTVTNAWEANPSVLAGLETARRLNSGLNPTPSAPMVDWGITLAGGLISLVAAWQTRRAGRAQAVARTVIRGIETYPGKELDKIKAHVAHVSEIIGTDALVADTVKVETANVSGPVASAMADGRITADELIDLVNDPAVRVTDLPENYRAAFLKLRG